MEEVLLLLHSKFEELGQRLGGDKDREVEVGKMRDRSEGAKAQLGAHALLWKTSSKVTS